MDISVIIPTYKPQDYLWVCLDSLVAQTFPKEKFEVILVLNGCDKPYKGQIEKYIEEHQDSLNIKLIHTLQGGVSNARNIALDNAEGQYICFIDDDDHVSPAYLQELYSKASGGTIVISNTFYFKDGSTEEEYSRMAEVYSLLAPEGKTDLIKARRLFFSIWMKLIPRDVIGKRRFEPSLSIGEDCVFMFLISDRVKSVDFTSADAVYYRRLRTDSALHSHNQSKKVFINDMRQVMEYTKIYLSGLRRYSFHFFLTRIRGAIHFI